MAGSWFSTLLSKPLSVGHDRGCGRCPAAAAGRFSRMSGRRSSWRARCPGRKSLSVSTSAAPRCPRRRRRCRWCRSRSQAPQQPTSEFRPDRGLLDARETDQRLAARPPVEGGIGHARAERQRVRADDQHLVAAAPLGQRSPQPAGPDQVTVREPSRLDLEQLIDRAQELLPLVLQRPRHPVEADDFVDAHDEPQRDHQTRRSVSGRVTAAKSASTPVRYIAWYWR